MLSPMLRLRFYLVVSESDNPPDSMHVCSQLGVVLAEAHLAAHIPPPPTANRTFFFGLSVARVCMLHLEMHAFPDASLCPEMHAFPDACID
jgi:hypothetical protein